MPHVKSSEACREQQRAESLLLDSVLPALRDDDGEAALALIDALPTLPSPRTEYDAEHQAG